MTSIVIAIVIIFNMIVNLIPENKRQFDISSTNIYEISSKSEKIIKKVDDDVTFYVLAEKDSTDKRIKTFINKYASLSSIMYKSSWIGVSATAPLSLSNTKAKALSFSSS